ncbi:MAG TPA: hypothetical protein VM843_09730 [Flavisolibacter sp.]|nr:hypothetical protein [Flavisolibacter sp.]
MKVSLPLLILCLFAVACGNSDNHETSSTPNQDLNTQNDTEVAAVAAIPFPELFAHLEQRDTAFFAEGFGDFSAPSVLDTLSALPYEKEEGTKFRRFIIYNGDSSRAIDPYSYNHLLVERGGREKLVPGGPDTEVGMIDFAKGTRQRLLYFGPSYILMDARWKGTDTVLFAITEAIAEDKISPEIWEVDLGAMTKRVRRYPDTLSFNVETYRSEKLDGIGN